MTTMIQSFRNLAMDSAALPGNSYDGKSVGAA